MITIPAHVDILGIAERLVGRLTRKARTNTGEYAGGCPFCGTGDDRFLLWPDRPREDGPTFWCRICHEHGDIIDLVMHCEGVEFREALAILGIEPEDTADCQPRASHIPAPPSKAWQERAFAFARECKERLQQSPGILDYLHRRGLKDETINRFDLGYNDQDEYPLRTDWGLPVYETEKLKLPRGITIPYLHNGAIWKINIRKAKKDLYGKYHAIAGSQETIFNLHSIKDGKPVVLVESELDALSGSQEVGALAVFVATSGVAKMYPQHLPALELASLVLVAFDLDENVAGDTGAEYWLQNIPKAMRCDPWSHDLNDMLKEGKSLREWLETGLALAQCDVEIDEPVAPADTRQEWKQKLDELFDIPEEKAMT